MPGEIETDSAERSELQEKRSTTALAWRRLTVWRKQQAPKDAKKHTMEHRRLDHRRWWYVLRHELRFLGCGYGCFRLTARRLQAN